MPQNPSEFKSNRMLELYLRLQQGDLLKKAELAHHFRVTERSIQRDMESMRCFLAEQHLNQKVIYDKRLGGYRLIDEDSMKFSNEEALAAIKILLESRSLTKAEMFPIVEKMLLNCIPKHQIPVIRQLIANEQLYYVEPHHGKLILETLWQLGEAVSHQLRIRVSYAKLKEQALVSRVLEPVGIMFSEYYFYLIAYIADPEIRQKLEAEHCELYPTIYRVDRIQSLEVLKEQFRVPYLDRFQEGAFRKRVQFMYGGKLQTVRFQYSGLSVEAVLDRLPTAEVLEEKDGVFTIQAEVFGEKGIDMWLRSQGENIKILHR